MTSPLQEAIAKAEEHLEAIRVLSRRENYDFPHGSSFKQFHGHAVVALDSLTPLRADDDTRYVKVTKQQRDDWQTLAELMDEEGFNPEMSERLKAIVAAYDAVAPNAKEET